MDTGKIAPRDRIIAALDTADTAQAVRWVEQLSGAVGAFKLGLEFVHAQGPAEIRAVQEAGADRLFFDGKFSDIPQHRGGSGPLHLRPAPLAAERPRDVRRRGNACSA